MNWRFILLWGVIFLLLEEFVKKCDFADLSGIRDGYSITSKPDDDVTDGAGSVCLHMATSGAACIVVLFWSYWGYKQRSAMGDHNYFESDSTTMIHPSFLLKIYHLKLGIDDQIESVEGQNKSGRKRHQSGNRCVAFGC